MVSPFSTKIGDWGMQMEKVKPIIHVNSLDGLWRDWRYNKNNLSIRCCLQKVSCFLIVDVKDEKDEG